MSLYFINIFVPQRLITYDYNRDCIAPKLMCFVSNAYNIRCMYLSSITPCIQGIIELKFLHLINFATLIEAWNYVVYTPYTTAIYTIEYSNIHYMNYKLIQIFHKQHGKLIAKSNLFRI